MSSVAQFIDPINGVRGNCQSFGFADPEPVSPEDNGSDRPTEDFDVPDTTTLTNLARVHADCKRQVAEFAPELKPHVTWTFGVRDDGKPIFGWIVSGHGPDYVAVGQDEDPARAVVKCKADITRERRKLDIAAATTAREDRALKHLAADMGGVLVG